MSTRSLTLTKLPPRSSSLHHLSQSRPSFLRLRPLSTATATIPLRLTHPPRTQKPTLPIRLLPRAHPTPQGRRPYTTGKSTSDIIVEELQDLYETAKDEFEIATESTDAATIYAASDREAARDALNELLAVYTLYTRDVSLLDAAGRSGVEKLLGAEGGEEVRIDTGLNPQGIEDEVRQEVRRRVGQRVRELKAAVEGLEERAGEE
ncbi:uncharacterized protein BO72DRAFT_443750 [Aspergillus fijiensis CBS 313.89]|uniref:Uncharacterized protein n=1 Tax=Aspergillus fijiensis CBS 313.89 TaxID=1448319 RepID=A0A8G1S099_9EURO|nr:uncharacterized protein BO72DRAFT_443750 [Aspergillus fijiensis CBS 313.89]RAK82318.1 hypothetical protein BO72DRAFT_443750 [Aspergillus fijiensis CBS 313.89]